MKQPLSLARIRKRFDTFLALDDASFELRYGEMHALLGENGAGKSTLMNVAAGLYRPDSGVVMVDGTPVTLTGPRAAHRLGIGMVHQHFKLVRAFTVAENILLANPSHGYRKSLAATADAIRARAAALGFTLDPNRPVHTLSVAEQQQMEILKVLLSGAHVLVLDEPTAVLTDAEADRMLGTMRELARTGRSIVLVTHRLQEVRRFADRVTVMRGGRTVAEGDARTISADELTRLIVGDKVDEPHRRPINHGTARLSVTGLKCARSDGAVMLQDASFTIRAGEIYGVAGVAGNGQSELAEAIMGVTTPLGGSIEIAGIGRIDALSPARRRAAGIAAIPADRYAFALAGQLSVVDNYGIGQVHTGRYGGALMVARRGMAKDAAAAITAFDVQGVRALHQRAALLSGGNAQKLVLARELSRETAVIVAHSPSRGLDVRATAAVRTRLLAARETGAAVLLISDDLDEVLSLSDRVGVMTRGRIVAEFMAPADPNAVGRAMVGHA